MDSTGTKEYWEGYTQAARDILKTPGYATQTIMKTLDKGREELQKFDSPGRRLHKLWSDYRSALLSPVDPENYGQYGHNPIPWEFLAKKFLEESCK